MNNFMDKFMMVAGKVAGQRHLQALRDGIILTMPLIIIGSAFLIFGFLPIPGYPEFMASVFGEEWLTKLLYPVDASFGIMALIAGFGIAYRLAEKYDVDPLSAGAISVAAFLLATPYQTLFTPPGTEEAVTVTGVIPAALMGSSGLFVAMLIAMLSTEIYRIIVQKDIVIKMPEGVPPSVAKSFTALIPGFAVIITVWILRLLVERTSFESIHSIVGDLLQGPLTSLGSTLIGSLIAVLLIQLLWSTGLHGASIVGGVMGPIWLANMDQNRMAFQSGEELPNIVTQQFFDIWIYMGGSGATLAFVIAMLLFARSQQMKQMGRLAIGPGLFNINEPVIFGTPIVMNPLLMIPFILAPLALTVTTYIAMTLGLVPYPAGIAVPWTMTPIIGGYLASGGHISAAILQLVNLGVAFMIYFPFFKRWDKMKLVEEGGDEKVSSLDSEKKVI